jgi:hypothetical protein
MNNNEENYQQLVANGIINPLLKYNENFPNILWYLVDPFYVLSEDKAMEIVKSVKDFDLIYYSEITGITNHLFVSACEFGNRLMGNYLLSYDQEACITGKKITKGGKSYDGIYYTIIQNSEYFQELVDRLSLSGSKIPISSCITTAIIGWIPYMNICELDKYLIHIKDDSDKLYQIYYHAVGQEYINFDKFIDIILHLKTQYGLNIYLTEIDYQKNKCEKLNDSINEKFSAQDICNANKLVKFLKQSPPEYVNNLLNTERIIYTKCMVACDLYLLKQLIPMGLDMNSKVKVFDRERPIWEVIAKNNFICRYEFFLEFLQFLMQFPDIKSTINEPLDVINRVHFKGNVSAIPFILVVVRMDGTVSNPIKVITNIISVLLPYGLDLNCTYGPGGANILFRLVEVGYPTLNELRDFINLIQKHAPHLFREKDLDGRTWFDAIYEKVVIGGSVFKFDENIPQKMFLIQKFLELGINHLSYRTQKGSTHLHTIVKHENVYALRLYYKAGVNPNVKNHEGKRPYDLIENFDKYDPELLSWLDA